MSGDYAPRELREKWQAYWEREKTFRTPNPGEPGFDASKPKSYILDFFPYPSGAGLHVGHPEGYAATDIIARYRRMRGYNVLHPMGWDAFGLPAEQHAIETGQHPAATTERNVNNFRRQLKLLGFSYDWDRELSTTDPDYFRWTQWIFLQIFNSWYDEERKKARPISELPMPPDVEARGEKAMREFIDSQRLAYIAEVPVNWCPALGTVLANEEVTNDGRSERGDHPVFKRPLRQWMMRITKYADRLADELEELDWPEAVKLMQRNWIGRSEGAQVRFRLDGFDDTLEIFTTRPDTLFGATYMVLAPEHPLVEKITTTGQRSAVRAYCETAIHKSELARTAEAKEKTGVFTGAHAINPVNNEKIPIWVADYVLMGYGTGAIMAVPAHDERDFEFSRNQRLRFVAVVQPTEEWLVQCWDVDNAIEILEERRGNLEDEGGSQPDELATRLSEMTKLPYAECLNCVKAGFGDAPTEDQLRSLSRLYHDWPQCFGEACVDEGIGVNSGHFNGLPTAEFKKKITAWLEERGLGKFAVNCKIRDWLFSRQRYWGEPFPILHGPDGELVALDEKELPLTLPEIDDFRPTSSGDNTSAPPDPPLGRAKQWMTVQRGGRTYKRELNTMPQWAGSCWYYLRFLDPKNTQRICSKEAEQYWMVSKRKDGRPHIGGIDLYLGGAEHAVLHLLYARFWHKVLYDLGHVSTPEPFGKLFNQGMIRAFAYKDSRGVYRGYDEIEFREDGAAHLKESGEKLAGNVEKMSKSLKNVINPEEVVEEYGSDSLRLYEMFMGPLEASKPWNPRDVPGVFRFLQRVWRLIVDRETGSLSAMVDPVPQASGLKPQTSDLEKVLHKTIKKVTEDIERMAFNTAISAMMEFVNEAYRAKAIGKDQAERFVLVLAPFAPHLCEDLWQRLRGPAWKTSLAYESWPTWDAKLVEDEQVEIPVQVNGKLASRLLIAKDAAEDVVVAAAMKDSRVAERLGGKSPVKTIYVAGRMLNLVVK